MSAKIAAGSPPKPAEEVMEGIQDFSYFMVGHSGEDRQ